MSQYGCAINKLQCVASRLLCTLAIFMLDDAMPLKHL